MYKKPRDKLRNMARDRIRNKTRGRMHRYKAPPISSRDFWKDLIISPSKLWIPIGLQD